MPMFCRIEFRAFRILKKVTIATLPAILGIPLSVANVAIATDRVGDFALLDQSGTFHQLSYYGDHAAVVLLAQDNNHHTLRDSLPQFTALREAYQDQNVLFLRINPMPDLNRNDVAKTAQQLDLKTPILLDTAQTVAESLGLTRVGELIIVDPATMTVAHRGTITQDQTLTHQVIQTLVQGERWQEPVPTLSAATVNVIPYPGREQHLKHGISYSQEIVPILKDHCVACHQTGGIAPWAMDSHLMVQGFGPMIKEVVTTRRMPPGQIDQHVSHAIRDVAGLTAAQEQTLIHWIDAGAPNDAEVDPLTQLKIEPKRYTLGEPDLVYKIPAQAIPATGLVDYRYVPLKLNLDRDVWVRAMEFVPGDRQVLHHVIAYVQSPADRSKNSRKDTVSRGESVGGYAPGRVGEDFGENGGRLLQKGANLLLQMHYTTKGIEAVDETEIGIFLHDTPPKYVMSEVVADQRRFLVPPHVKHHELVGEELIERDAYLYAMMPHMHYRGKRMAYFARYPDGQEEQLLSVPNYDFNWQFNYQLEQPVFLPAGTKLVVRGAMDNSDRNTGNPDPSQPVHFGLQTQHEMFFGFTTLRYLDVVPQGSQSVDG